VTIVRRQKRNKKFLTNVILQAGNKPLLIWLSAVQCGSLQQLLPITPTERVLIWPLATWRSGERYESRSPIGTKLDVSSIVFVKTLNATYLLWKSSFLRKKGGSRKKANS
jgi:hypothetical protein